MFRKFFAVIVAMLFIVGGLFADTTRVKGLFRKFEGGKVTVESEGKNQDYKPAQKVQFKKNSYTPTDIFAKFTDGDGIELVIENNEIIAVGKAKKN